MTENGVLNSGSSSECPECLGCVRSADDGVKVIFGGWGGAHLFPVENVSEEGEGGLRGRGAQARRDGKGGGKARG